MGKIMDTRIVKIIKESGAVEYHAQYKNWIFWTYFADTAPFSPEGAYEKVIVKRGIDFNSAQLKTLDFQKDVIDKYLELATKPKKDKIKSKEYIEYP